MSALVSAVIVNYNFGRFLPSAIDSALSQSYHPLEVIVVDDGSQDDSHALLNGYGDRLRWFQQQRQGVSAARNRGIAEAGGEFIAFMDADDYWHVDKLKQQLSFFADRRVGMVYAGLLHVDEEGQPLRVQTNGCRGDVLAGMALMTAPGVPAAGSSAVVRRECFDRVGTFCLDLSTSADWDMWRRIACHYHVEHVPEPLICYRQHRNSMHRQVELFERDMLQAFARMFRDPAASAVFPLRRRCYANLYATFSASFYRAGKPVKAAAYGLRALLSYPPSVTSAVLRSLRASALPKGPSAGSHASQSHGGLR